MSQDSLRQLPKVELHRHLECSMRLSTVRELAQASGMKIPAGDADLKKHMLVTEPMNDLVSVLNKFLATQKLLSSEEILTRITTEVIEDAYAEGIRVLELRYAPTFIRAGHEHLSFAQIHQAICRGVRAARYLPIAVGLICIVQRTLSLQECAQVIDFAIENKKTFVAVDLADNEVGSDPGPFAPLFAKARKAGLHVTIHSGESDVPGSELRVREAIEMLGAERIGHGVQIYKSKDMIEFVKNRQVPLELCPTSNWLTNAVASTAAHPIRFLHEAGVYVSINSDDPGVFDIDLTHEYEILKREQKFTPQEFEKLNDIAASYSFIPLDEVQRCWPRAIDRKLAPWNRK